MSVKKLNIAFFVHSFPSISEIWIVNQIIGLIKDGHRVDIYAKFNSKDKIIHKKVSQYKLIDQTVYLNSLPHSRKDKIILLFQRIFKNIEYRNFKLLISALKNSSKKNKTSIYSLIHFLDKPAYDIVHAHYGFTGNNVLLLKKLGLFSQSKLVTTFHGFDLVVEKGFYDDLIKKGDVFSVNSVYSKHKLLELSFPSDKINILPVGLNTSYFKNETKIEEAINKLFTIVFIGRMVGFKTPNVFVEICKKLKENNLVDFKALMVGGGELYDDTMQLINKYNLQHTVTMLGNQSQEEIKTILSESDVLLMTGIELHGIAETQGLVIQEAQSMSVPVIVSNSGGMKEGMIDAETGFVINENDVDLFVEKICYLYNNPSVKYKMGEQGRSFVVDHFDSEVLNDKLLEIYNF